jgi:hypothetical protein
VATAGGATVCFLSAFCRWRMGGVTVGDSLSRPPTTRVARAQGCGEALLPLFGALGGCSRLVSPE